MSHQDGSLFASLLYNKIPRCSCYPVFFPRFPCVQSRTNGFDFSLSAKADVYFFHPPANFFSFSFSTMRSGCRAEDGRHPGSVAETGYGTPCRGRGGEGKGKGKGKGKGGGGGGGADDGTSEESGQLVLLIITAPQ